MTIWNGITEQGAVVPIQVDAQGRVVVAGSGGSASEVYGCYKAFGCFTATATQLNGYNLTGAKAQLGYYTLYFSTPLTTTNYGAFGVCTDYEVGIFHVVNRSTTSFNIRISNHDGAPVDRPFSVVVFDDTPTQVTPLILPSSVTQEIKQLKADLEKLKKDKNP